MALLLHRTMAEVAQGVIINGVRPDTERMLVRTLLSDAVLAASFNAGYLLTPAVFILVEQRLEVRQGQKVVGQDIIDAIVTVLETCPKESHVVVVIRVQEMEACICTVHGMRWDGEEAPPHVVLKLVDVAMGGRCVPLPIQEKGGGGEKEAEGDDRSEETVRKARTLLALWLFFGVGLSLSVTVALVLKRLLWDMACVF